MSTCDKSGTQLVDRTYQEGDKAIMELKGSSQYQQFRGMCGLYPGCVKVRHQPCCCPEACNKGEYWNCKYADFAGDWHDYFITPSSKHNEGNEAIRRQGLVSAAQGRFFNSVVEGQLLAFVSSEKGCRQDVSFCVAKKKKPPAYSAQPAAVPSSGRSRARGGGSNSGSATNTSDPVMRFTKPDGTNIVFVSHLEKLDLQGNGADQYILRGGVPVMLSEESLIPAALTKAGVFGYTSTATEYHIPTAIKQSLWHSFAFTKWVSDKGERYPWMN
jgi:hypothetical protein